MSSKFSMNQPLLFSIVLYCGLVALGCNTPAEATPTTTTKAASTAETGSPPNATPSAVARIVFIGQKEACECTRKRIDGTWSALEAALKGGPEIPVEKLQLDVDKKKVGALTGKRALLVAPGIYFLDDKGEIVDLLQGEVDETQIIVALR